MVDRADNQYEKERLTRSSNQICGQAANCLTACYPHQYQLILKKLSKTTF